MKKITYLAEEEIKKKFKADVNEIDLADENITRILMVEDFDSLKIFDLSCNAIKKIEGLYLLVNLQKLYLGQNQIGKIEELDTLANLQVLDLQYNDINKLEGLINLVHLKVLLFSYNSIQQMEGLNQLVSLQELNLSNNQIRKIEGLDRLINLKILNLSHNMIGKIEGLDKLVNLERLYLTNNKIRKLEGLESLVNMQILDLEYNKIREINDPSQITSFIHLTNFYYDNDVIVHPVIVRFIDIQKLKSNKLHIYNDSQNIHDNSINRNITKSVNRLMKDVPLKEVDKSELLNDLVLTVETKQLLLDYIDHKEQHTILLLTFAELFGIVWQVIQNHPDGSSIKEVLNQEMTDSICKCFTGRMNRLVNVLNGFDPRVVINITDSDAIANVIIILQKKYTSVMELKDAVYKELTDHGYDEAIIKEWISYIE